MTLCPGCQPTRTDHTAACPLCDGWTTPESGTARLHRETT